ncbi:MAG: sulfatase, partial [Candidatus Pacearchaeota archaeon]|nr:sulfatase [Candidatus Pacearchaeota archaeon]
MRMYIIGAGVIGIALLVTVVWLWRNPLPSPEKPYNLIVISIDTLRADHLGLYGYSRDTSPNLDAFSKEALVFDQAIAQAPFTLSSHASILTSQYPSLHGLLGLQDTLAPSKLTIAEALSQYGYQTAAFVGGGDLDHSFSMDQGFSLYIDSEGSSLSNTIPLAAKWLWLNRGSRVFAYVQGYDVHGPYEKPEPYGKMFTDPNYAGVLSDTAKYVLNYGSRDQDPKSILDNIKKINGKPVLVEDDGNETPLTQEDIEYIIARYDGGIRYTDDLIGGFFDQLQQMGLYDDSLIIVLAGHGESLGDDLARQAEPSSSRLFGHGQVYDELIRAPLLIKVPGFEPARISSSVQLIDLFPTILDFLGIPQSRELKNNIQGTSMLPLLEGEQERDLDPYAFGEGVGEKGNQRYVRTSSWKLIVRGESASELYDLQSDPGETVNVIGERQEIAGMMKEAFSDWLLSNL